MNIRRSILWLCLVAIVLLAVVVWLAMKKPVEAPLQTTGNTNVSLPAPAAQRVVTNTLRASTTPSAPATPVQDKKERIQEGLATLNDVPIDFYGKLEDQFSNPVVGAEVVGSTIVYNGKGTPGQRFTTTSDANGLFQFNGSNAESLGIMPRLKGYALASTNTEFKYSGFYPASQHVPDPNNPVIIKMWKLQGAEPLVAINDRLKCRFTDGPLNFDLLTGKIVPTGGDIKITLNRPEGEVSQRNPQDWSVQVEAVGGGLIETSSGTARITYSAPEAGYQPSDTLTMSITNHWSDLIQQMYFATSRNGQVYSKIFLSMSINVHQDDPVSVSFRGIANANNSRNWEASATIPKSQ